MNKPLLVDPTVDAPVASPQLDPYPYGWRDLQKTLPNGELVWMRVPLTLADVLHPQEDDVLMPSDEHERYRNYLYNVLKFLVRNNPTAIILSDTNVAWDVPEVLPHRPDIAVIFNVRERKNWSTFAVAEEGTRPALIIEITSPKTRQLDLDDKLDEYELTQVPFYIIVDIQGRRRTLHRRVLGWQLTADGYAPIQPDTQGRLWLAPVQAWLAFEQGQLVCYDAEGRELKDYPEIAAQRDQAEARAKELEARLRALEEQLRRQTGQGDH